MWLGTAQWAGYLLFNLTPVTFHTLVNPLSRREVGVAPRMVYGVLPLSHLTPGSKSTLLLIFNLTPAGDKLNIFGF